MNKLPALAASLALAVSVLVVSAPPSTAFEPDVVKETPQTIASGAGYTVWLDAAGRPFGIGSNDQGQLTGTPGDEPHTPRALTGLPSGVSATAIDAWNSTVVVRTDDGRLFGTGDNLYNHLTGSGDKSTLTPFTGLPAGEPVTSFAVGARNTYAIVDGALYGTGRDVQSQLFGGGTRTTMTLLPMLPGGVEPVQVATGGEIVVVVGSNGKAYGAGNNLDYQLTDGFESELATWQPISGAGSLDVAAVAAGSSHVALLTTDGEVYTRGLNTAGQLGVGDDDEHTTLQHPAMPGVTAVALDAGPATTLTIGSDGRAHGTGFNSYQELTRSGVRTVLDHFVEGPTFSGEDVTEISGGSFNSVVRAADGLLYGAGDNTFFQLGLSGCPVSGFCRKDELVVLEGQNATATVPPTIAGTAEVGQTLTATGGTWTPSVGTSTFSWERDGVAIPSATGTTYMLTGADAGYVVRVRETRDAVGYARGEALSDPVEVDGAVVANVSAPVITGTGRVGTSLTVGTPGAWTPADVTRTYQWFTGGSPIAGATGTSYEVAPGDVGATLTVRETASKATFSDGTAASNGIVASEGVLSSSAAPVIGGPGKVGTSLSVTTAGVWSPSAVTRSYQWLRNGSAISGATGGTYQLRPDDLGAGITISVRESVSRTGYTSTSATSNAFTVQPGDLEATSGPVVIGTPKVGETLSLDTLGGWSPAPDATRTYQWFRGASPVEGATATTYVVAAADVGTTLTLKETVTKTGYTPGTAASNPRGPVVKGQIVGTAEPVIGGSAVVDGQLSLTTPATWSPAPGSVTYQWTRTVSSVETAIAGATSTTYVPSPADVGAVVRLRATATRAGYDDSIQTSNAATVLPGTFSSTPTPTVSGTVKVGSTLTASSAASVPTSTRTWQWFRGTTPVGTGAATYKLVAADAGESITVRATFTRAGYTTASRTSSEKRVPAVNTSPPTISGTFKVGKTVSMKSKGTWFGVGYAYTYQWLRNGSAISAATKTSYKLTSKDKGRKMSLKVTARKTGFGTVTATSASSSSVKK